MTNTPPPGRTRDDLIGIIAILVLATLFLIFFPSLITVPFRFIFSSVEFVFTSIGTAVGMI